MVTMAERMATVENEIGHVKTITNSIEHKMDNFIASANKMQNDFIKKADRKYASKLTEKIVFGMVGVILTIFLYAIVRGIII